MFHHCYFLLFGQAGDAPVKISWNEDHILEKKAVQHSALLTVRSIGWKYGRYFTIRVWRSTFRLDIAQLSTLLQIIFFLRKMHP
jgi:hypothetical protein